MRLSALFLSVTYMVDGTMIVVLNAILALAIILNRSLRHRKELVFITGLAVADTMYGIGLFDNGRDTFMNQVLSNDSLLPATPMHCFLRIGELFVNYPCQVSLLTMVAISVERLIAIVWVQRSAQIQYIAHVYVLLFTFGFPLLTMGIEGVQSYLATNTGKMINRQCVNFSPIFTLFMPLFKVSLAMTSVVVYAFVLVAYFVKVSPLTNTAFSTDADVHTMRRRRLTQTLAIITGFTLIFYCIPYIILLILNNVFGNFDFNWLIWLLLPLQYLAHVLVFYWRQKEIRQSIKALVSCGSFGNKNRGNRVNPISNSRIVTIQSYPKVNRM